LLQASNEGYHQRPIRELKAVLATHLPWHGVRIRLSGAVSSSLCKMLSINMAKLVTDFSGAAQVDSHYKRLKRFFRLFETASDAWARPLAGQYIAFPSDLWNFQIPVDLVEIEGLALEELVKTLFNLLECCILMEVFSQIIFSSQPHVFHRILFWGMRGEEPAGDLPVFLIQPLIDLF